MKSTRPSLVPSKPPTYKPALSKAEQNAYVAAHAIVKLSEYGERELACPGARLSRRVDRVAEIILRENGEMTQSSFVFSDPALDSREKPRLSSQCGKILRRLREGTATNWELAALSLKYTARISDDWDAPEEYSIAAEGF